jgi:3-dehydrosphinganine reductase
LLTLCLSLRNTGLTETLRSELALYDIDVQIFQPGTILSPGLENENKTKPEITKRIEGHEEGLTPEQAAAAMLKGELIIPTIPTP